MLSLIYRIYFFLRKRIYKGKFLIRIISFLSIILRILANISVKLSFKFRMKQDYKGINTEERDKKVIVSLTTFPARIDTVWLTIETLLNQSYKPDFIILWLAKEQFNDIESLPQNLLAQQKRGLQIRFCDDLKSHKKYYYAFKEYPRDIIITVDDDIIYPKNTLEILMNLHEIYPESICCNRGHLIKKKENQEIASYKDWIQNPTNVTGPTEMLCPTGVSGVLYPPNSVNKEVFNKDSIKDLCLYADDLWLKIMSLKNNTKVVKSNTFPSELLIINSSQKESLAQMNVKENKNDLQLQAILKKYSINFNE